MEILKKYRYLFILAIAALLYFLYKNRTGGEAPKPTLYAIAKAKPLTAGQIALVAGKTPVFQPGVVLDENDPGTWPIWQ